MWTKYLDNTSQGDCRQNYIPGLNRESCKAKAKYKEVFKHNLFSDKTFSVGEKLIQLLCGEKSRKWHKTVENIDVIKNSKIPRDL